ncbi:MAG: class I SAM-dependent methyltransferase [Pseudomonadota bacterium]
MSDDETLRVYEARAQDYAAMGQDTDEDRAPFVAALPPGTGPVLDWGCGPGHDAAAFAALGLAVEATDATAAMVDLARAKGVAARQEMFEALNPAPRYRGIWANFSLLHAAPGSLPDLIALAAGALLPGGVLHVGMKRGQGAARDTIGRHYIYVEGADLDRLTAAHGLTRLSLRHGHAKGMDGRPAGYVIHLSRKAHA